MAPDLVVAMGATATGALTGSDKAISKRRGTIESGESGVRVLITWHPSYLLRLADDAQRVAATREFASDLQMALDYENLSTTMG